jgi:pSer/pThr/pTyr-binding forkhead associated (FHA) protein
MQDRFTLRFQNGEREGESVPITAPRFTLGRRPGNTLQIQDASVSGEHAELLVTQEGLLLRDLDSTNGTRIGGHKVTEGRPAHGDVITFGSINAVLEDSEFLEGPGRARSSSAAPAGANAGEAVEVVSAELVAKSRKGSKFALLGVVVLVVAGGGAAAFLLTGGGGQRGNQVAAVAPVEGNKLAGYSFEGDKAPDNWTSDESAPAYFSHRGEARASGKDGMRATLGASEWALLASDPVGVPVGRSVELVAQLRARSGASGRVGVEFLAREGEASASAPGSNVAWGPWISDVTQHQEVRLVAGVPPGSSGARALVEARGAEAAGEDGDEDEEGGSVDVDDVSLRDAAEAAQPSAKLGEFALWLHGQPSVVAQVTKVSTSLLGDLRGLGESAVRDCPLASEATAKGFRITPAGAQALSLRAEPAAWNEGLATIGAAGLVEHAPDFEATDVRTLLLGTGHDQVALDFGAETRVTGRREGAGLRLRAELPGQAFTLQVDFREERARAGDLAFAARNAEQAGNLGECLARWNELLVSTPYEPKLVQEARATRSRLEQAGLIELRDVAAAFERARFFRLVDLFRQCRTRARAVGTKYAGSAVETQAQELVAEVEEALGELEVDLSKDEVARLQSIVNVLEQMQSPRLAEEVRDYLREQFGVSN